MGPRYYYRQLPRLFQAVSFFVTDISRALSPNIYLVQSQGHQCLPSLIQQSRNHSIISPGNTPQATPSYCAHILSPLLAPSNSVSSLSLTLSASSLTSRSRTSHQRQNCQAFGLDFSTHFAQLTAWATSSRVQSVGPQKVRKSQRVLMTAVWVQA